MMTTKRLILLAVGLVAIVAGLARHTPSAPSTVATAVAPKQIQKPHRSLAGARASASEGQAWSVLPMRPVASSVSPSEPRSASSSQRRPWNAFHRERRSEPLQVAHSEEQNALPLPNAEAHDLAPGHAHPLALAASLPFPVASSRAQERWPDRSESRSDDRPLVPVVAAPGASKDDASESETTGEESPAFLEDAEFWEWLLAGDEDDLQGYLDGLGFGDYDAERILESYEDRLVEVPEWFLEEKGLLTESEDGPVFEAMWGQSTAGWWGDAWRGGW